MIWIDKNKIRFESLDIEENARYGYVPSPKDRQLTNILGALKSAAERKS